MQERMRRCRAPSIVFRLRRRKENLVCFFALEKCFFVFFGKMDVLSYTYTFVKDFINKNESFAGFF